MNKTNRFEHQFETIKPRLLVLSKHGLKQNQLINTKLTGDYLIYEFEFLIYEFSRKLSKKVGVAIHTRENLGNKDN